MLSVFPEFLNFQILGIFLIRVTVGLVLFYLATKILFGKKENISFLSGIKGNSLKYFVWVLGITLLLSASFMIVGFLTQVVAIICAYLLINIMLIDKENKILNQGKLFYGVLAIISLSFLFLGPGIWSVDLPL